MAKIDWEEYKVYKHQREGRDEVDNFEILLEFLRSYYNKTSPLEVFDALDTDPVGKMMLEKREIFQPEGLEAYLYRRLSK